MPTITTGHTITRGLWRCQGCDSRRGFRVGGHRVKRLCPSRTKRH